MSKSSEWGYSTFYSTVKGLNSCIVWIGVLDADFNED
jgi:hypothetical protein